MQIAQRLSGYTLGGRRSSPPPRHGQEESFRGDGEAVQVAFVAGAKNNGVSEEQALGDFQGSRRVRFLRLQQKPLRRVCADHVSNGLPEGALPDGILRGAAHGWTRTRSKKSCARSPKRARGA